MAYTPRFFIEKLRTKVEYLNPFQVVQFGTKINKEELSSLAPLFSEVIGLGLRNIIKCPIEISLKPSHLRTQQNLKKKLPYFYASCASVVLCLVIILLSVNNLKGRDKDSVAAAESKISKTAKLGKEVAGLNGTVNGLSGEYNEAISMLQKRTVWMDVLNELQRALPDNTWLVSVKGIGNETPAPQAAAAPSPRGRRGGGDRSERGGRGGGAAAGRAMPDGDPTMFGAGMFGPGGPDAGQQAEKAIDAPKEFSWIQVTGHSLVYKVGESPETQFRVNLTKGEMFSNQLEEIKLTDFNPPRETNITTFTMDIKLKQVIVK